MTIAFVGWKYDNVCVPVQVVEDQSFLSSDILVEGVWPWKGYLSVDIACLFWWKSVDSLLYLGDNFFLWDLSRCHCEVRAFGKRRYSVLRQVYKRSKKSDYVLQTCL